MNLRQMIVMLAGAVALSAQGVQAKSSVDGKPSKPLAVVAMHNFAACVADRAHKPEAVLALAPGSEDYQRAMRRLARGHDMCGSAGGRLRFNPMLFAGGLAERLLEQQRPPGGLVRLLLPDPAAPPVVARDEADAMALCTVRRSPDAVAALFATGPASDDEKEAMTALGPTVAACLAAGRTLRINRPGLRSLIAVAAYRLARPEAS
jgi:hypothetical protein